MNRRESMRNAKHKNTNDPQKQNLLGSVSKNILLEGLNKFHGASLALDSVVDELVFGNALNQCSARTPIILVQLNMGLATMIYDKL